MRKEYTREKILSQYDDWRAGLKKSFIKLCAFVIIAQIAGAVAVAMILTR